MSSTSIQPKSLHHSPILYSPQHLIQSRQNHNCLDSTPLTTRTEPPLPVLPKFTSITFSLPVKLLTSSTSSNLQFYKPPILNSSMCTYSGFSNIAIYLLHTWHSIHRYGRWHFISNLVHLRETRLDPLPCLCQVAPKLSLQPLKIIQAFYTFNILFSIHFSTLRVQHNIPKWIYNHGLFPSWYKQLHLLYSPSGHTPHPRIYH